MCRQPAERCSAGPLRARSAALEPRPRVQFGACSGAARDGIVSLAWRCVWLPGRAAARQRLPLPGPAVPGPGPDILYRPTAGRRSFENRGIWRAKPILVSGASAYREGEFLYQDFLYDDHGAHRRSSRDPGDPRVSGDTFSAPNGTYTYPTAPAYADNAADLVELRVKPLAERDRLPAHPQHA